MSETEVQRITLENCWIEYKHADGKVTLFGYAGQPHNVIQELMERYLLPKQTLAGTRHPYHPKAPWWGSSAD